LRNVADAAGESRVLAAGPGAVPTGIAGPVLDRERTTADEVETYLTVTADAAEDAPRLPGAVLELTEVNKYLAEPLTRGDLGEAGQRTADVAVAGGAIAFQEGERAVRNPNRALAEVGLGVVTGRAGIAARRAASGTGALDDVAGLGRVNLPDRQSSFWLDDRAQADLTGVRRGGDADSADADSLDLADEDTVDNIQRQETNELARQGQQQAEFEVEQRYGAVKQDSVPEVRDELRSDNPSADDIDASAQRGGNPQVAGGEDISFAENFDRAIRAKNVPGDDLRVLDSLADDLGTPSATAGSKTTAPFVAGGTATAGAGGLSEIRVGEGTTGVTQPATFDLEDSNTGVSAEDSLSGTAGGFGTGAQEESSGIDGVLDIESPTVTWNDQPGTGTDVGPVGDVDTEPITDQEPGNAIGEDTDTAAAADTAQETDQPPFTDQPPVTDQPPIFDTPAQTVPARTPTSSTPPGRTSVLPPGFPGGGGGGLRLPDSNTGADPDDEELFPRPESDSELFDTGVIQDLDDVFGSSGRSVDDVLGSTENGRR